MQFYFINYTIGINNRFNGDLVYVFSKTNKKRFFTYLN
jgi:hypothetical protein